MLYVTAAVDRGVDSITSVNPRILVLVLSIERDPWERIERFGQRSTWANPLARDISVPVYFYRGTRGGLKFWSVGGLSKFAHWAARDNEKSFAATVRRKLIIAASTDFLPGKTTEIGDVLTVSIPETYGLITAKLCAALNYLLENKNFDYILRTNSSTYIDRTRLARFVGSIPKTGYYGGFTGISSRGVAYASGTGILMSRDVVEMALNSNWDYAQVDDVALGEVLARCKVELQHIGRPGLTGPDDVADTDLSGFMWRCKGSGKERNDVDIMLELHRVLNQDASPS
jgi:hypothetical protein